MKAIDIFFWNEILFLFYDFVFVTGESLGQSRYSYSYSTGLWFWRSYKFFGYILEKYVFI